MEALLVNGLVRVRLCLIRSGCKHHVSLLIFEISLFYAFLCISRFGLRIAELNADNSSSKAVASPSPALPKRRLLQCRNQALLIPSLTPLALTAPPLLSQAPAWP